ncbi:uncharacterized protein RCO7_08199 [Rhynchosporium graminicola]|uniref:Uncharacterized protein n=1 Tax=Rhynchosporium graminicola TaxID=2792576 RepID=A0A1E1LDA0_9HELO|nr:uncharacterized protein RCO7_08199 [Rhynchosporium commune]
MYGFAVAGPPGPTSKDQKIRARRFCPGVDAKSAPSRAVTITESNPNTLQNSPEVLTLFTDTYDLFMLGPSSAWGMRVDFQHSYLCSPVLLHDILAVLWTTVKRARDKSDALDQSDVARGAVSLRQLRTAHIENVGDTVAIFALGQTLAAFDLLTSCNSSTSILRYLLMSISPWYESVSNNPTLDPVIITSVSWDTLNCLVKRDVPMIKHISREAHIVDRLAGFGAPLLPILYDLCIASQRLEHHCGPGSGAEPERIEKIQQEIFWWKPEPPSNLASNFSKQEILTMQAQASMYRTAALLFCPSTPSHNRKTRPGRQRLRRHFHV